MALNIGECQLGSVVTSRSKFLVTSWMGKEQLSKKFLITYFDNSAWNLIANPYDGKFISFPFLHVHKMQGVKAGFYISD